VTTAEQITVLRSLRKGDRVEVVIAPRSSSSPDERRTLEVTSDGSEGASGYRVYTSSGRVRPGNVAGGMIIDWSNWGDGGNGVVYQPTLAQNPRAVRSITVLSA
jgi:hypothetical protein